MVILTAEYLIGIEIFMLLGAQNFSTASENMPTYNKRLETYQWNEYTLASHLNCSSPEELFNKCNINYEAEKNTLVC